MSLFQRAEKKQAKARIGLIGPSGSGKTYTALLIASTMGKKIAVIDTEHGSASKYADEFTFDVAELTSFHPDQYIKTIEDAGKAGYEVLVIDSASHEWSGKDGCLEMHDRAVQRFGGNSYMAWAAVTPFHNRFIEAINSVPMHVIVTYRSKTDYLQVQTNGKTEIQKVGLAAVTREGAEYELDIVGEMDQRHNLAITKTRCRALTDQFFEKPGADLAGIILTWLNSGAPVATPITAAQGKELWDLAKAHGQSVSDLVALINGTLGTTYQSPREVLATEFDRVVVALRAAEPTGAESEDAPDATAPPANDDSEHDTESQAS